MSGRFSKDYQPSDRGRRGKEKRTMILDALYAEAMKDPANEGLDRLDVEPIFYGIAVRRALMPRDPASGMLLKELLARLYPSDKATMPAIKFDFPENGDAHQKIEAVTKAVAEGILPVDMGNTMVSMIVAGIKVFEVTELADRLARIEEMLTAQDNA